VKLPDFESFEAGGVHPKEGCCTLAEEGFLRSGVTRSCADSILVGLEPLLAMLEAWVLVTMTA
jgi:hypothetical protein